jgi:rhamnosyltransferase
LADANSRCAALIVVFQPEPEPLRRLIGAIAPDVGRVFLYLNDRLDPSLLCACQTAAAPTPFSTLGSGVNEGLGRAYNAAVQAARTDDYRLLALFDQDSAPAPGMIRRLVAGLPAAVDRFGPLAAIGPRPVATAGQAALTNAASDLVEAPFLISSGAVLVLDAVERIGAFREDFFIDGIDIEWCFRGRAKGFRCVMARGEVMPHRLGAGRLPGLRLARQPPMRLFTFARNQTAMMRLAHVPSWWKARTAALLMGRILVGLGGLKTRAILHGIRAGIALRLGPPPGLP